MDENNREQSVSPADSAPELAKTGRSKNSNPGKKGKRVDGRRMLRRLTLTAVFTAFAVVLKAVTNMALAIPGLGIKVGFAGIFTFFPAILCGPVYGGIASGLSDLLGYLVAPDGAYVPWLTITAFAGGVIKGLLWQLLTRREARRVRIALLAFFMLIGSLGAAFNISLAGDGVIKGIFAVQDELPGRGQVNAHIESGDYSPLTRFAVGLARYNKDTLTLASASGGNVILPTEAVIDGLVTNITKIAKGALATCTGNVYIPSTYKTIAEDAFGDADVTAITVIGLAGSAAQTFATEAGIGFSETENIDKVSLTLGIGQMSEKGFTVKSSDTYRKYLANYLNLTVAGFEFAGCIGVIFIALNLLMRALEGSFDRKKRRGMKPEHAGADGTAANTDEPSRRGNGEDRENRLLSFIRILTAITVAGLVVTTANTFILQAVLPAWSGRAIIVLLIPRIGEELAVCLVQAYVISLLYGIVARGRVKKYMDKL